MCLGLVGRPIHEGACVWIPSLPQRVIGPAAYYPLEGGGVMKEPPPSLIVRVRVRVRVSVCLALW